jgi:hypothetical protein
VIFGKKRKKGTPQSYRPVMDANEVIELFSRLTLHQQAALCRLISRNLALDMGDDDVLMGYDFDWNVVGAMIVATPAEEDVTEPQSPIDPPAA